MMIKSVARCYSFTLTEIKNLYHDDADFFGLEYWYNDAVEMNSEIAATGETEENE